MAKQYNQPLVSIIVPVLLSDVDMSRCLESISSQTYKNIEIIIIKDKRVNQDTIVKPVNSTHEPKLKFKLVSKDLKSNFIRAQMEGLKVASGDYVMIVNAADHISIDYIRVLISRARRREADIIVPEVVFENKKTSYILSIANDPPFDYLVEGEFFAHFFEQHGENPVLNMVTSKMYSRRLINETLTILSKIKTQDDFLVNTILWALAKQVDSAQTAHYYLCEEPDTLELNPGILRERITRTNLIFSEVSGFLQGLKIYKKFERDLMGWMNEYSRNYHDAIASLSCSNKFKDTLLKSIQFGDDNWVKKKRPQFNKTTTQYDDRLEEVKVRIVDLHTQYISFDVFDTLVSRPFLHPSDMFYLMDSEFAILDNQFRLQSFHDIRVKSEELARNNNSAREDVTLSEIYEVIQNEYFVEERVAIQMLEKELEYEKVYCSPRETAKELYDLALYLGKKIIITSDMYLPTKTIEDILEGCGYNGYHKLYVSSHYGTMKSTQNLYRSISTELNSLPETILHIGDNYQVDVAAAEQAGWGAVHFPKATELVSFERIFGADAPYAHKHLGITVAYALAVNKYFDNPFRIYDKESNYNCSPYFMGYFALGLAMVDFTRWMIDDLEYKNIESAVFLSRDGYLPLEIFRIFQERFSLKIQSNYLPTSRKATIPLSIFSEVNVSDLKTFNYRGKLTPSILESLKGVLREGSEDILQRIDLRKTNELQEAFINTYKHYFRGKTAVVDIGYSGRPEQVFERLFNVPIQTYFIYTSSDEAKRRLGKGANIYSSLSASGIIQERLISEFAPSCIGYAIIGTKVQPITDKYPSTSYYEKYAVSQMQRGAKSFAYDYLKLFYKHFGQLEFGQNALALKPLSQLIQYATPVDREIFRGLMHEDDIAGDSKISVFNKYYDYLIHLEAEKARLVDENTNLHNEKVRLSAENKNMQTQLISHLGIKRSAKLLAGNIRRRFKYGKERQS